MSGVWQRADGRAQAGAVVDHLERGKTLPQVLTDLRLEPADLIAALGQAALADDDGMGAPALTQSNPRRPGLRPALEEGAWTEVLPRASRTSRLALAAGLLQIHDFWDASHEAAQQADDLGERNVSAYWHGIAHRREPDPSNASYWFRRVGRHSVFEPIAAAAAPLLETHGEPALAISLIPNGTWNPFAFIDYCGNARRDSRAELLARGLQRLEMIALLDATADAVL